MVFPPHRNKNWSKEEDSLLVDLYKDNTAEEIASLVGRSRKAVERRIHRLGISGKVPKVSLALVRERFMSVGWELLSDEYANSYTKLLFRCDKGHLAEITWNKFQGGRRCPRCYYDRDEMLDRVVEGFASEGYSLVSAGEDYVDSHAGLSFVCPNGHEHTLSWNCFSQGQRCVKCIPTSSRAEKDILTFVSDLVPGVEVLDNTREIIHPLELDIYLPQKKLAIEYCGLRWHGEVFSGRPRDYHYTKYKRCVDKGVRLITIFEDEYLERPLVVQGRIKHALGLCDERLFARKLRFGEVSVVEARDFLEQTHLQGYSPCSFRFGLFSDERLVQVMTFGRMSRAHAGSAGILELKRLASLPSVSVVGGASKLFKGALQCIEGVRGIKSYCDMRWANPFSSAYEKMGFSLVGLTKYTPHYVMRQKRYRNQTLRKTPEERKTGKTEWELRREQGYDRIWDCGHRTYFYSIGE